jgi:hypothetical protein
MEREFPETMIGIKGAHRLINRVIDSGTVPKIDYPIALMEAHIECTAREIATASPIDEVLNSMVDDILENVADKVSNIPI